MREALLGMDVGVEVVDPSGRGIVLKLLKEDLLQMATHESQGWVPVLCINHSFHLFSCLAKAAFDSRKK